MNKRIKMLAEEATVGELKQILNQVDNSDIIEFTPQASIEQPRNINEAVANNTKLDAPGKELETDSIVASNDGEPMYQAAVRDINGNIIMHNSYSENHMTEFMKELASDIRERNVIIADNFARYMGEAMYNTLEYVTQAALNIAEVNKADTLIEMCKVIERG